MFFIICKIQIEGFHKWDKAPDEISYLRSRHRHVFEISVKIKVEKTDRQIEIIQMQDKIKKYLYGKYGNPCEFNGMSCEEIAFDIANKFEATSVTVLEDGYGGATYERS